MILTIDRLGHLGDGVAQGPDGPIFVPHMLPGEVVEGDLQDGKLLSPRILTPSVNRVRPPCVHARTCGGCLMQHAADPFVADWKLNIVKVALAGQGLSTLFRPIVTSPQLSARARSALRSARTHSSSSPTEGSQLRRVNPIWRSSTSRAARKCTPWARPTTLRRTQVCVASDWRGRQSRTSPSHFAWLLVVREAFRAASLP